jgi:Flp pilus assembly protein TadG
VRDALAFQRGHDRGGVALVEFAIVLPLLFLMIFGIIDFGWAFYQKLDVRHGARETARLVAVNYNPDDETDGDDQAADIIEAGCARMDNKSNATVSISHPSGGQLGARAVVTITKPIDTLTKMMDPFLPATTSDSVAIRLEQTATWNARTQAC